jgi:hypothetical protein
MTYSAVCTNGSGKLITLQRATQSGAEVTAPIRPQNLHLNWTCSPVNSFRAIHIAEAKTKVWNVTV